MDLLMEKVQDINSFLQSYPNIKITCNFNQNFAAGSHVSVWVNLARDEGNISSVFAPLFPYVSFN